MSIDGSCGIGLLCSNMRIKENGPSYNMELQKKDFETQKESYKENTKVVPQFMKALGRAHE